MIEIKETLTCNYEVDVLVVGGGPAGTAAAFAAARLGKKTMIVEQFNCLGGVATAGGHGHMCLYSSWRSNERVVGGIPFEIVERTTKAGFGVNDNSYADFEVEGMKLVLEQMAAEDDVQLLYHTFFADLVVDSGRITHAIVQNKNGRQVIAVKQVVDATGDGDVAWKAGCEFDIGDEETGLCQPVSLMFTIGGVDYDRVKAFRAGYADAFDDHERPGQMRKLWKKAQDAGDMRPFQSIIMGWWWTPTRPDQVGINFTHVTDIDSRKAEDLTAATIEARKQAYETIDVYRKYVPGMENCYMVSTPNTVGIRESRRIHTDYVLTKEDVLSEREFDDAIGYGSFFIDIHNTRGIGLDAKTQYPDAGFKYQIPWRICLPKHSVNLQVAGRCAGADHEALGSLRVMPQCAVMGQAAGAAASLALENGCELREVAVSDLQAALRNEKAIIDTADIATVNAGVTV